MTRGGGLRGGIVDPDFYSIFCKPTYRYQAKAFGGPYKIYNTP